MPSTAVSVDSQDAEVEAGDIFYPRLLQVAEEVGARVVLVEVADMEQAIRVARMVVRKGGRIWKGCEVWRDWPAANGVGDGNGEVVEVEGEMVRVRGEGNGRAVLAWRSGHGGRMIGKE